MTSIPEARRELLELILRVSYRREHVVLSSGKESDFYLDLRQTLMRPRGVLLAGTLVLERLLSGPPVDAVGGMAVGAVPVVTAVLAASAGRDSGTSLLGFFVRKETKRHGLGKRIEGAFEAGQSVALLEDTVTTGGSTLKAIERARAEGLEVVQSVILVDRQEGGLENIAAYVDKVSSIINRDELIERWQELENDE